MPHQLVYLLPPDAAPAAESAVASAGIPETLRQVLLGLGRARRADLDGLVYTYCLTEAAGRVWHVMSCFSPAETGGGCVVHHLAFSADEASSLKREESRPTPAGLMAGLVKDHFWRTGSLPAADTELPAPQLNEDSLPDPSAQAVWQALTGHKHYAARPNKSPYDTRCALLLPEGGSSKQALRLLHESDWLTENCGWGVSFCAGADADDVRSPLRRLACCMQGETARAARLAGYPLLPVQREERAITPTQAFSMPYDYADDPDRFRFTTAHGGLHLSGKAVLYTALPLLLLGGTALFVKQYAAAFRNTPPPALTFTPLPDTETTTTPEDEDGTPEPGEPAVPAQGETPAADDAPAATEETDGLDTDGEEEFSADTEMPPTVMGKPKLLQVSEKLPESLQAVLRQANGAPLNIPHGELTVAPMNGGEAQHRTLCKETPLHLARIPEARGQWLFTVEGSEPLAFTLSVQQEHLVALEAGGEPVAVSVTLPKGNQILIPYILTSRPQAGEARQPKLKELPKAADYLPTLTTEHLACKSAGGNLPFGRLSLKKRLPTLPEAVRSCKLSFTCPLPQLGAATQPCPPKRKLPKGYRYTWHPAAKTAHFGGTLLIERGMEEELESAFNKAANTYCCGDAGKGDDFYSLATLYGITLAADRARNGNRQAMQTAEAAYTRLFADRRFNAILQQVLVHEPALTMDTALANDRTPDGKRRREMVLAGLRSADNCARIRMRVAEVLSNTLHAAYERKAASYQPLQPIVPEFRELNRTAEGALLWKFNLIPAADTP